MRWSVLKIKSISFLFNKESDKSLYHQLYDCIVQQVFDGYMKVGDQLPSIRSLANQLKLSKTTIENTYEMLLAEGYIISYPKVGYFIDVTIENGFSSNQVTEKAIKKETSKTYKFDFSSKSVDETIFNISIWKKYLKNVLEMKSEIGSYGNPQGELFLREELTSYSYRVRGVHATSDRMIIGAGIQPLLSICLGLFLDRKITIAIEEEGFIQAKRVFLDSRCELIEIKKDSEGINIQDLKSHKFDILYLNTTSSGKNKKRISAKLRFEILKLATKRNFYILEDDHNGELFYTSRLIPAMQGFDQDDKVIYIGSFSKLLLPSIRLAYMVLPTYLMEIYNTKKDSYNQTSSKIEQLTLAFYIQQGVMERYLKKLRKLYLEKSQLVIKYIEECFPNRCYVFQENTLQIQLFGPFEKSTEEIMADANQASINLPIYHNKDLMLSFSGIKKENIKEACILLSEICSRN